MPQLFVPSRWVCRPFAVTDHGCMPSTTLGAGQQCASRAARRDWLHPQASQSFKNGALLGWHVGVVQSEGLCRLQPLAHWAACRHWCNLNFVDGRISNTLARRPLHAHNIPHPRYGQQFGTPPANACWRKRCTCALRRGPTTLSAPYPVAVSGLCART